MDFTIIGDNWRYLLWGGFPKSPFGGAALTILISLISGLSSAILGTVLGILLAMKADFLGKILEVFLWFFRAIPVMMLIFWTYFLLPVIFDVDIPAITTVVCVLTIITSSYLAHVVKAGILAVSKHQWQSGLSLGFNRWQVLLFIILPQAIRMMGPSFVNQWIALIKDTSLAYIVGVNELTFLATQVNNRSMFYPMEIFLFVGCIYFVLCFLLDFLMNAIPNELIVTERKKSVKSVYGRR